MTSQIPSTWINRWKRSRQGKWCDEGFDWAAGMLLRGATKEEIEGYLSSSCDAFDQGVIEAIREWILKGFKQKGDYR